MRRTSPTEQEERDQQRERNLLVDVLLDELKNLQLSQVRIINDIYHIRRSGVDRTPDPGPTAIGTNPQDTEDDQLRVGDKVKLKTHGKFRATTGTIVKVTDKRVIVELPNGQTTNRAPHNLRKL